MDLKFENAITLHQCLISYSSKYDVSLQVMAQRIVGFHSNIGFLRGGNHINAAGKQVIKLSWGYSSLKNLTLMRNLHLKQEDLLGKGLLASGILMFASNQELTEIEIPNIGFASGHRLKTSTRNANTDFVISMFQPKIRPKQLEMLLLENRYVTE